MYRYEMSSNYQGWRPATPKENLIKLLEENPGRTITIEDNDGSMSKWRQASRNGDIVLTIKNVLQDCRVSSPTTDIATKADVIYDALLNMGHLND